MQMNEHTNTFTQIQKPNEKKKLHAHISCVKEAHPTGANIFAIIENKNLVLLENDLVMADDDEYI